MKVAIYSRKSKFTGKGDSVENQVQICKDYINSNIKDDKIEFIIYEDEGFSGGNLDRPQFKKLMKNVKNIDMLICYRLDRISRNVADFSTTLELLQANNCDFVSVKEQFDTSSPMGRAMIYIASVFAQLERETIAERVKDNMLEMAKNGHWTGGKIPVGFNSIKVKYIAENGMEKSRSQLVKDDTQASFVKSLYEKYLELGSLHKLECYIAENNIRSSNGILFEKSTLKIILQNTIYVKANDEVLQYLKENNWTVYGEADNTHSLLTYNKTEQTKKNGKYIKQNKDVSERLAAVSSIEGFIEPTLWLNVQRQFDKNKDTFPRLGKTHNALLVGKLKCGHCKEYMLVQHGKISKTTGEKLFYYTCSLKRKSHKKLCANKNAAAAEIESLILYSLRKIGYSKKKFIRQMQEKQSVENLTAQFKNEISMFEKNIYTNKNMINNLMNKLALSSDPKVDELLLKKISDLNKECTAMEIKIESLKNDIEKEKISKINLDIMSGILDKCSIIDTLPRVIQKSVIDCLIKEIYFFGGDDNNPKNRIEIKFIDEIGDDISTTLGLQNCTPSTC